MAKRSKSHWYSAVLLVAIVFAGLVFLGYRFGKIYSVSAVLQDTLTLSVNTDIPTCNIVLSGEGRANATIQLVFQYPDFTLLTTDGEGKYTYVIDPNDPNSLHYLAPGVYTANTQVAYPDKLTPVISNPVTFTVVPGPCAPTPTVTPIPTLTSAPVPTLTTVPPSPTPALVGICHWTSGSKGWNALPVSITNPGHAKHTKDFMYAGPRDNKGNPTKDGDAWCNAVE